MRFVIVGTGRCGTRLLVEMLNLNPEILVVNESHFLVDFRNRYGSRKVATRDLVEQLVRHRHANGASILDVNLEDLSVSRHDMENFFSRLSDEQPMVTASEFYDAIATFWMRRSGKVFWADKTPDYGCFLRELREMWPDVRVLHITRNGLSVAKSMMGHVGYRALLSMNADWWGMLSPLTINWEAHLHDRSFSGAQMLELWARRQMRIAQELHRLPEDSWMELSYEELISQPVAVLCRVARFVGISEQTAWLEAASARVDLQKVRRAPIAPAELGLSDDLREAPTAQQLMASDKYRSADTPCIIGLAMVKNEEEMIEPFVRHNLQFLTALYVLDNGSSDRTREILLALQREGLPLVVLDDPTPGYFQSEKMTRLLRSVSSTLFPDFVVPLDADEFLKCATKTEFLRALSEIPVGGFGLVPWCTYIITPEGQDAAVMDPPRSMEWRRLRENPSYFKALLRLDGQYLPELGFTQGNHGVEHTSGQPVASVSLSGVSLGHFPVRSATQMEAKAVIGWMAYLLKNPRARSDNHGYQWRDAFDFVAHSGGIDHARIAQMSVSYAQHSGEVDWTRDVIFDPMDFSYERTHSTASRTSSLALVARAIEGAFTLMHKSFAEHIRHQCDEKLRTYQEPHAEERCARTVFEAKWHYENLFLDLPPMQHILNVYRPDSVLDVGCGIGAYLSYFIHKGVQDCLGMDGIDLSSTLLAGDRYIKQDLSTPFDLGRQFDLVMCVEVVEHLPSEAANHLLLSIAKHARSRILFSAAEPGQPGYGHINCRPLHEWLHYWENLGWVPDTPASLAVRCVSTFHWLRRNPVILVRADQTNAPMQQALLLEIARRPYRWHNQHAAIISNPLSEDLPTSLFDA
jgi:2-polyprenyl-3-methyl-5-hydroxy-6-metoxy-1,4-benzoquinol methylase